MKQVFAPESVSGLPELKKLLYTTDVEERIRVAEPGAGN
jgi:hypothetical protein